MKVSQDEPEEENGNINILVKEIKSWKEFECVLRDESAVLFNKILSECGQNRDYVRAVISKGVSSFRGVTLYIRYPLLENVYTLICCISS
ncbi:MAG: hypothetical protein WBP64_07960 [Nitrososphaeraceae archaeon]